MQIDAPDSIQSTPDISIHDCTSIKTQVLVISNNNNFIM